ncbi:cupin domain-containing protein [Desulfosediminicola sp.]|uniref:cupin domain-containing protein n=1 Tax=Desulfosediminicola sp. TaxID=2886825 RepID=UPI003AF25182
MAEDFTKTHFDFASLPWLTSPRKKLKLEGVALGLINLPPNEGYTFTHTHRKQEEVYLVIEGSGCISVNGDLTELVRGDCIRVSPHASRALKAHDNGLLAVCCGAVPMGYPHNPESRYMIDDGIPNYDEIPEWYQGREDIIQRNQELKKRMERAAQKRGGQK